MGVGNDRTPQGRHGAHSRGLHGGHPGGAGQEESQPAVLRLGLARPPHHAQAACWLKLPIKSFQVPAACLLTFPGLCVDEWGCTHGTPSPGAALWEGWGSAPAVLWGLLASPTVSLQTRLPPPPLSLTGGDTSSRMKGLSRDSLLPFHILVLWPWALLSCKARFWDFFP